MRSSDWHPGRSRATGVLWTAAAVVALSVLGTASSAAWSGSARSAAAGLSPSALASPAPDASTFGGSVPPPGGPNGPAGSPGPAAVVWANLTPWIGTSPGGLLHPSVAYDPSTGTDLLYGGRTWNRLSGGNDSESTWSFHNGAWTQLHPLWPPGPTSGATMSYDPNAAAFVFVLPSGPGADSGALASTFEFASGAWNWLDPTVVGGPPGTTYGAMAWDPAAHSLVRFGGERLIGTAWQVSNATWLFQNGSWVNATTPHGPPGLVAPSMAYDPAKHGVVLFGGTPKTTDEVGSGTNDTWLWANGSWTQLTVAWSPPPVLDAAMAWDATLGGLVLAGGGPRWANPPPAPTYSTNYAFVNGSWAPLTPVATGSDRYPGFVGAGVGTDPATGGILLFGGCTRSVVQNTTWVLDRDPAAEVAWTPATGEVGMPIQFRDPLLAGRLTETALWSFGDGTTDASASPSHAFSAPGTYAVNVSGSVTVGGVTDIAWAVENVTIDPLPVASAKLAAGTIDVNGYATVSGSAEAGVPPYTIAWSFGDGGTATGSWSAHHQYSTAGTFAIVASVTDSLGGVAKSQVFVHVQPYPRVDLRVAQVTYDVGQTVLLSAATSYGSAPFSFVYSGLPPGCASANVSNYTCQPTDPGQYGVGVTVVDAHGLHVTSGLAMLTVAPRLAGALNVSAPVVDLGSSVSLWATFASEGSGNVTVNFSSAAPCQATGNFQAACMPGAPGTYEITAVASDRAGASETIGPVVVVVHPSLAVNVTAPSTPVLRGTPVVLGVTVGGGTPPFAVAFENVPRGCASVNATTYRCDLQLVGTYSFGASVTDGLGSVVLVHVVVYVTAPNGGGGGTTLSTPPPPSNTDDVFWLLVVAAAVQIALSVRYARRPTRRQWERAGRLRKGLWSVFGSAPTDAADAEPVPGADASP